MTALAYDGDTQKVSYDCDGNILNKAKYAYTTGTLGSALQTIPYVYNNSDWKDKLTSYNGQAITYDTIGNPLNDGIWSYTWGAGRQLRQMSKTGTLIQFKYDHNGLRTQKIVTENGVTTTTDYTLHGKLVTHLTCGSDSLHFFYDAQSRPTKVNFNGVLYTYVHNLQGDIVGLLDDSGVLVVEYKYDAWGKLLATTSSLADTLGKHNPFRYRGYAYDEGTELYYLRSRYYNLEWGRFVNADAAIIPGILLNNSFAYCSNNPVKRIDGTGHAWYDGIVNAWNKVTSFIQECFQAQVQADIISAEQKVYAANKTISGAKKLWSNVKGAVSNWAENTAKPWLSKANDVVKTCWSDAKEYVRNAFQAQQQADIISAQMTYNAACKVGNWIADNWKVAVDWITGVAGVGSGLYGIVQTIIPALPAIPLFGQVVIVVAGFWGLGRLAGLY